MSKLIVPSHYNPSKVGTGLFEYGTDTNMPLEAGKVIYISEDDVPIYQKIFDENPDFFVDQGIVKVRVMNTNDYNACIRKNYEKFGTTDERLVHINDLIEAEKINEAMNTIDTMEKRKEMEKIDKNAKKFSGWRPEDNAG